MSLNDRNISDTKNINIPTLTERGNIELILPRNLLRKKIDELSNIGSFECDSYGGSKKLCMYSLIIG